MLAELDFVRRRADPDRDRVLAPGDAAKIADRHRHQVRRHSRRGGELQACAACGPGPGVSDTRLAVADRGIAAIDDERERERRLERRLVEAGKCPPRVGRFELRDRIRTLAGLARVEAAQPGVQARRGSGSGSAPILAGQGRATVSVAVWRLIGRARPWLFVTPRPVRMTGRSSRPRTRGRAHAARCVRSAC